jgi:actin-binding protein IPP
MRRLVAVVLFGALTLPASASAAVWRATTPMPAIGGRELAGVVSGASGHVYVFGGFGDQLGYARSTQVLDPRTGRWQVRTPMPYRAADMATARLGTEIYLIGGHPGDRGGEIASVAVYHPRSSSWTAGVPLPAPRRSAQAVVSGGRIYVLGGGRSGSGVLTDVLAFDPVSRRWTTVATLPDRRYDFAVARDRAGVIYVIGGQVDVPGPSDPDVGTVSAYDPATGTWSSRAPLPHLRRRAVATLGTDGRIYVTGGIPIPPPDPEASHVQGTRSVLVYDPSADAWSTGPPTLVQRFGHGMTQSQGRLWVIGGVVDAGEDECCLREAESLAVAPVSLP